MSYNYEIARLENRIARLEISQKSNVRPNNEIWADTVGGKPSTRITFISVECEYSTFIQTVSYDVDDMDLTVSMHNGKRYVYSGVPLAVMMDLQNADSVGCFFNNRIKGQYAVRVIR